MRYRADKKVSANLIQKTSMIHTKNNKSPSLLVVGTTD